VCRTQRASYRGFTPPALVFFLAVPLLLTGCAVGPRFQTPRQSLPARFHAAPQDAAPLWPHKTWWHGFGSKALDRLILAAEQRNFSIRVAVAQLQAANAQAEVAGAPLLPAVNASGNAQWQRTRQGLLTAGGGASRSPLYGASVQASYELDFWGKNRDALRAALADAAASRFNRDTVALSTLSSVATTWFQILADRAALSIGLRNLHAARRLLRQFKAQFKAGTVDIVTVAQQSALVASERANIPILRSNLGQETLSLGLLVGQLPEDVVVPRGHIEDLNVPPLEAGLPSGLLTRRPDVAQARAQLISANARVRGAIAAFFPTISLTGSASTSSAALHTLLQPGSLLESAASSLSQPLFEGGALTGQLAVSRATYREYVVLYEEAVVRAFTDVETSLTAFHYAQIQARRAAEAVREARKALTAVKAQLQAGIIDVSVVLTAEQTLLSNENAYTQAQLAHLDDAVKLYEALGGGWHVPTPSTPAGS